jgi:hypothetical protein
MEKLIVENFLGIKSATVDVRPITILIGQQASGKSVLAKLLYYFRSFPTILAESAIDDADLPDMHDSCLNRFYEYFPKSGWGKKNFRVRYEVGSLFVEIVSSNIRDDKLKYLVELRYTRLYKEIFAEIRRRKSIKALSSLKEHSYRAFEIRQQCMNRMWKKLRSGRNYMPDSQMFVPAGRSFFTVLQNNIFSFLSSANAIDPFLGQFGQNLEAVKHFAVEFLPHVMEGSTARTRLRSIDAQTRKIIGGEMFRQKGKDFLRTPDGRSILMANASSGQQEVLPLFLVLKAHAFQPDHSFRMGRRRDSAIYIEEPEAHLFPESQKQIVDLIAFLYNDNERRDSYFLTTHSPYVLSAFNNLMLAGRLINEGVHRRKVKNIVAESRALDPGVVGAYALSDGGARSIIDEALGIIDTNIIDSVSNMIGSEFDSLLELC